MDFNVSDFVEDEKGLIAYILVLPLMAICVLILGYLFNIKLIKTSLQEKGMTWKLDVTNSCLVLVFYTQSLLMNGITYLVQDIYKYTGSSFCYVSKVLTHYGVLYMSSHTLVIAILKYILIVWWQKSLEIGKEKIKSLFFWINFLHPIFTILLEVLIRPDFFVVYDGYAYSDRCLGDPKNNLNGNGNRTLTKLHNICKIETPAETNYINYILHLMKVSSCWTQVVFFYMTLWNLLEAVIYCLIFKFMRR